MNRKSLSWVVRFAAVFVLALGAGALANAQQPVHYKGLINDYAPAAFAVSGITKTGTWEIRGTWSLNLKGESGTANFSAALNMELSDYAVVQGLPLSTDSRKAHTHHITMNDAMVTENPTDCPASPAGTPGYTSQFEVSGPADVSGNGGMAFSQVPLQVCIDGGSAVQYSNITLMFTIPEGGSNPAANHFGPQPIRGVVRKTK
jgi:hypothetical protein